MNDGGPAFPQMEEYEKFISGDYVKGIAPNGGMSLRDYFAGQAIAGFCSGEMAGAMAVEAEKMGRVDLWESGLALKAYCVADAMLSIRHGAYKVRNDEALRDEIIKLLTNARLTIESMDCAKEALDVVQRGAVCSEISEMVDKIKGIR